MSKLILEWSNFRESLLMALAAIRASKPPIRRWHGAVSSPIMGRHCGESI